MDKVFSGFVLFWFCVAIFFGIGWVLNIIALIRPLNEPTAGMIVLRGIGVLFTPLGGILGWV